MFNSLDLNIYQQMAQEAQTLNNFPNIFDKLQVVKLSVFQYLIAVISLLLQVDVPGSL